MARTAAVCLPHDWLTWCLRGSGDPQQLVTDRGDASGSGWWSPIDGRHREDLIRLATGRSLTVPVVLAPHAAAGAATRIAPGAVVGAGTGDNMAAALGLGASPGDVVVSIGTSGVAAAVSEVPARDPTGIVAGFADATGRFLPLVCTLNAARVLDVTAELLGVDHARFSDLALEAPAGAGGLTLLPYLEGERTPNLPDATGSLFGIRLANLTPANLARAAVEAVLCGLRTGLDALDEQGATVRRMVLTGGGSRSLAVRSIAPSVLARDVIVPRDAEYVALGAARLAAWVLRGSRPTWVVPITVRRPATEEAIAGSAAVYERHREHASHVAAGVPS
jgi:xylulokinase